MDIRGASKNLDNPTRKKGINMPEINVVKTKVDLPPVIILSEIAFLPILFMLRLKFSEDANFLAVYFVAKGKITGEHSDDYFTNPVVVIPGKLRQGVNKATISSRKAYSGAALLANVKECRKIPNGIYCKLSIYRKVYVKKLINENKMHFAEIENMVFEENDGTEAKEIRRAILGILGELSRFECFSDDALVKKICKMESTDIFADGMIYYFNNRLFKGTGECFSDEELTRYFNEPSTVKKLQAVLQKLIIRLKSEQMKSEISEKTADDIAAMQKKFVLHQRAEALQKELDELQPKNQVSNEEQFMARIKAAGMPKEAEDAANKQLQRLKIIPHHSPEYAMTLTYLDWLCDLPWKNENRENTDIANARQILDNDHYGVKKVKQRIIEHLSILKLKPGKKPPILCFIGPPGVGKTSFGKSIARAMGREFVRISLGGVRDEAEIRGHRRTYVGALPGRIIQGLKRAGTKNLVFMLDEIDKLASDFRGDPSAALLEALDSEQNYAFSDHYLEVPYDLSPVFFICTANLAEPIPPALKDRLEIIHLSGYTRREKYEIARQFLIPKQIEAHGMERFGLEITDSALYALIDKYTREAGVRKTEEKIASVFRNRAVFIAQEKPYRTEVEAEDLLEILGPELFETCDGVDVHLPGVVTGLAWTEVGGVTMLIEACKMTKFGNEEELKYTGNLGDVMKESIQVAWDIARQQLAKRGKDLSFLEKIRVHLHVPEGATPKDGPSAGAAMTTALISVLSNRIVRSDLAMTGEITLRGGGTILPVGGIKEKLLAAHRAGYKHALIPSKNAVDLEDISEDVKQEMKIELVKTYDDVFRVAFK